MGLVMGLDTGLDVVLVVGLDVGLDVGLVGCSCSNVLLRRRWTWRWGDP